MIPQQEPQSNTDLYNMVTIKNPLNEDFIFGYDNKGKVLVYKDSEGNKIRERNPQYNEKGNYLIRAGETRNFPKFIAQVAVKHLIDKILLKRDNKGTLLTNKGERDRIAGLIIVKEEQFERPTIPTDMQIVEQMNVESDLDRVLQKNKDRQKEAAPNAEVKVPDEQFDGLDESSGEVVADPAPQENAVTVEEPTKIDGDAVAGLPSREKMMGYAVNDLKIDLESKLGKGPNEGKTIAEVWENMSDQELFDELQLNEGDLE